jgi:hypothetical protein
MDVGGSDAAAKRRRRRKGRIGCHRYSAPSSKSSRM